MNNKKNIFLIATLFSSLIQAQTNLVANSSFENGPGTPHCNPSNNASAQGDRLDVNIDNWKNAETNVYPFNSCQTTGTCRSNTGWVDYYTNNCPFGNPTPHLSNRCVSMQSWSGTQNGNGGDGVRITLNQTLQAGHTYKLKYRFAATALPAGLRIYLAKFDVRWFEDPDNAGNQKLEIPGILAQNISSFTAMTWYNIERYFTVPLYYGKNHDFYNDLKNLVFYNDYDDGGTTNRCFLDDVELYDNGCCPEYMLYENTSSLPAITHVTKNIIAGYDAGITGTSGNVNILAGQHVTLKGASVSLVKGFYAAPGTVTVIQVDPCTSSSWPTLDPISQSIIPNIFTPNGDGVNDKFCITAQGFSAYYIGIYIRDDQSPSSLVYYGSNDASNAGLNNWTNEVVTNYQCLWDGKKNNGDCMPDGTFYYVIKLSNCLGTVEYTGHAYVGGCVGKRDPDLHLALDQTNVLNKQILISPNPSNGILTVQLKESSAHNVSIYNNLGQMVYQSKITNIQSLIDLSTQPKGIYFVKVQSTDSKGIDKVYTEKIIVQ